jgi:hypothetical protein
VPPVNKKARRYGRAGIGDGSLKGKLQYKRGIRRKSSGLLHSMRLAPQPEKVTQQQNKKQKGNAVKQKVVPKPAFAHHCQFKIKAGCGYKKHPQQPHAEGGKDFQKITFYLGVHGSVFKINGNNPVQAKVAFKKMNAVVAVVAPVSLF